MSTYYTQDSNIRASRPVRKSKTSSNDRQRRQIKKGDVEKEVNGKFVVIHDIALFEAASEGVALQKKTVSIADDVKRGIEVASPITKKLIELYNIANDNMPYPLNYIERDIKYTTIASYIANSIIWNSSNMTMYIDNGLNIVIDRKTNTILRFVGRTWGITHCDNILLDNTNLAKFAGTIGYEEYLWYLRYIINIGTRSIDKGKVQMAFFNQFFSDFLKACNGNMEVLNFELKTMLTYKEVPKKMELVPNTIIDVDKSVEYSIDAYKVGCVRTGEQNLSINLTGKSMLASVTDKVIDAFEYDCHIKDLKDNTKKSEIVESGKRRIPCVDSVFRQLCSLKVLNGAVRLPNYVAVANEEYVVMLCDGTLYCGSASKYSFLNDFASGIEEIIALDKNKVYFTKTKRVKGNPKVIERNTYCYDLSSNISKGKIIKCKTIHE